MARETKRAKLRLTEEEEQKIKRIAKSQTKPKREVERANILLQYNGGINISSIHKSLRVGRKAIYKCIDKALAMGIEGGLKDKYHRPKEPTITEEAKIWVMNLACTKPKEHGYAAEIWTHSKLAEHTRKYAQEAGHPSLKRAAKATIQRILKEHSLQPHKVKYYLEKRDPEFEEKMKNILCVYKEVKLQNESQGAESRKIITISADEKPGVQAIKNTAPDLPPDYKKGHKQLQRDYEYKRLGTLSILAGLDLHTGEVIAQVHEKHRSREFIQFLKAIDAKYPKECTIRIILDNHSSHISKETMGYLATMPNRFVYVHTPKHGSWLNLVESLFSKMARTFLKYIRVESKNELKERILKWVEEVNEMPVVYTWKKFDAIEV
jgi:transposase